MVCLSQSVIAYILSIILLTFSEVFEQLRTVAKKEDDSWTSAAVV